ncbi:MAG: cbb3-type cytochrome c oxidase subunit I [Caldilineales bacterium]|nr:cbb3-type cytochrome c oxidase subunit I [Caldilineales bacterium]MDW8318212.1 hypothetical protein [Anaerolineae bacterium]
MPTLTRLYVKTSLAYLVAALWLALVMALAQATTLSRLLTAVGPVYFHLFLVGWVTQLIMGIVFWMFPKYSRERPRGSERLAYATYGLLNAGLLLRAVGEPMRTVSPAALWGWLLVASALLQWLAGAGFVANTWGRVKER